MDEVFSSGQFHNNYAPSAPPHPNVSVARDTTILQPPDPTERHGIARTLAVFGRQAWYRRRSERTVLIDQPRRWAVE
ncbi:hypothetical protein M433DRAFT_372600 [Acidomyces richmondensis BFW]|nr:MAG: hypothetical protein FE78DRAFT_507377 [Acidomyces sp. 'richmondensis']KYG43109.1 hypothetical protein M433DRAFT_372600 [Acidomyces richmondensis BFW]